MTLNSFIKAITVAIPIPVAGVLLKYLLDGFDGVRRERYGVKGLAFICSYGPRKRPSILPRWMTLLATKLRMMTVGERKRQEPQLAVFDTQKAVAFMFNSGRIPLKKNDLFVERPLKIVLSGRGQLISVKVRFESEQIAGFKLIERRRYFFRPRNYLSERALGFTYIAPGHGVALDIEYRSEEYVTFQLSGPVDGMKHPVQEKTLFAVDVDNPLHLERQRKIATRKLWIGCLFMAGTSVEYFHNILAHHRQPIVKNWEHLLMLLIFVFSEWLALSAWDLIKQTRKIPGALRYWDHRKAAQPKCSRLPTT